MMAQQMGEASYITNYLGKVILLGYEFDIR